MKKKIIICLISVFAIFILGGIILYSLFHTSLIYDVSLEVGIKEISIDNFYKNGRVNKGAKLITDLNNIDLTKIGTYDIEIESNNKVNTVKLHLVDTTPPKVTFKDVYAGLDYKINPNDFIESYEDISDVTIEVESEPVIDGYKDYSVSIIVKDVANNVTQNICKLYISIVANYYNLELGTLLKREDIIYEVDAYSSLSDDELNRINQAPVGEYELNINYNNRNYKCKIHKQDTHGPELELNNIEIYLGQSISGKKDFIKSVSDASGEVKTNMINEYDLAKVGTQTIKIEAIDIYNNKTEKTAKLTIKEDKDPPVINGLTDLTVTKHSTIDYLSGVTAVDKKDGSVQVTVDSSSVNVDKYGPYFVTYTAKDQAGNVASERRKIYVEHDIEDTNALLKEYAAKAGDDYESIRLYVQKLVKYNSNWGEPDPVWYGLNDFKGNCYVHALIYQGILELKGYETKLIWTTDKTHYWNLVKINGVWRHSDSTPGTSHSMISADTDAVRYEHLQGRDWDRSLWPEAV